MTAYPFVVPLQQRAVSDMYFHYDYDGPPPTSTRTPRSNVGFRQPDLRGGKSGHSTIGTISVTSQDSEDVFVGAVLHDAIGLSPILDHVDTSTDVGMAKNSPSPSPSTGSQSQSQKRLSSHSHSRSQASQPLEDSIIPTMHFGKTPGSSSMPLTLSLSPSDSSPGKRLVALASALKKKKLTIRTLHKGASVPLTAPIPPILVASETQWTPDHSIEIDGDSSMTHAFDMRNFGAVVKMKHAPSISQIQIQKEKAAKTTKSAMSVELLGDVSSDSSPASKESSSKRSSAASSGSSKGRLLATATGFGARHSHKPKASKKISSITLQKSISVKSDCSVSGSRETVRCRPEGFGPMDSITSITSSLLSVDTTTSDSKVSSGVGAKLSPSPFKGRMKRSSKKSEAATQCPFAGRCNLTHKHEYVDSPDSRLCFGDIVFVIWQGAGYLAVIKFIGRVKPQNLVLSRPMDCPLCVHNSTPGSGSPRRRKQPEPERVDRDTMDYHSEAETDAGAEADYELVSKITEMKMTQSEGISKSHVKGASTEPSLPRCTTTVPQHTDVSVDKKSGVEGRDMMKTSGVPLSRAPITTSMFPKTTSSKRRGTQPAPTVRRPPLFHQPSHFIHRKISREAWTPNGVAESDKRERRKRLQSSLSPLPHSIFSLGLDQSTTPKDELRLSLAYSSSSGSGNDDVELKFKEKEYYYGVECLVKLERLNGRSVSSRSTDSTKTTTTARESCFSYTTTAGAVVGGSSSVGTFEALDATVASFVFSVPFGTSGQMMRKDKQVHYNEDCPRNDSPKARRRRMLERKKAKMKKGKGRVLGTGSETPTVSMSMKDVLPSGDSLVLSPPSIVVPGTGSVSVALTSGLTTRMSLKATASRPFAEDYDDDEVEAMSPKVKADVMLKIESGTDSDGLCRKCMRKSAGECMDCSYEEEEEMLRSMQSPLKHTTSVASTFSPMTSIIKLVEEGADDLVRSLSEESRSVSSPSLTKMRGTKKPFFRARRIRTKDMPSTSRTHSKLSAFGGVNDEDSDEKRRYYFKCQPKRGLIVPKHKIVQRIRLSPKRKYESSSPQSRVSDARLSSGSLGVSMRPRAGKFLSQDSIYSQGTVDSERTCYCREVGALTDLACLNDVWKKLKLKLQQSAGEQSKDSSSFSAERRGDFDGGTVVEEAEVKEVDAKKETNQDSLISSTSTSPLPDFGEVMGKCLVKFCEKYNLSFDSSNPNELLMPSDTVQFAIQRALTGTRLSIGDYVATKWKGTGVVKFIGYRESVDKHKIECYEELLKLIKETPALRHLEAERSQQLECVKAETCEEPWLGLELAFPNGKHNGIDEDDGVEYFKCTHSSKVISRKRQSAEKADGDAKVHSIATRPIWKRRKSKKSIAEEKHYGIFCRAADVVEVVVQSLMGQITDIVSCTPMQTPAVSPRDCSSMPPTQALESISASSSGSAVGTLCVDKDTSTPGGGRTKRKRKGSTAAMCFALECKHPDNSRAHFTKSPVEMSRRKLLLSKKRRAVTPHRRTQTPKHCVAKSGDSMSSVRSLELCMVLESVNASKTHYIRLRKSMRDALLKFDIGGKAFKLLVAKLMIRCISLEEMRTIRDTFHTFLFMKKFAPQKLGVSSGHTMGSEAPVSSDLPPTKVPFVQLLHTKSMPFLSKSHWYRPPNVDEDTIQLEDFVAGMERFGFGRLFDKWYQKAKVNSSRKRRRKRTKAKRSKKKQSKRSLLKMREVPHSIVSEALLLRTDDKVTEDKATRHKRNAFRQVFDRLDYNQCGELGLNNFIYAFSWHKSLTNLEAVFTIFLDHVSEDSPTGGWNALEPGFIYFPTQASVCASEDIDFEVESGSDVMISSQQSSALDGSTTTRTLGTHSFERAVCLGVTITEGALLRCLKQVKAEYFTDDDCDCVEHHSAADDETVLGTGYGSDDADAKVADCDDLSEKMAEECRMRRLTDFNDRRVKRQISFISSKQTSALTLSSPSSTKRLGSMRSDTSTPMIPEMKPPSTTASYSRMAAGTSPSHSRYGIEALIQREVSYSSSLFRETSTGSSTRVAMRSSGATLRTIWGGSLGDEDLVRKCVDEVGLEKGHMSFGDFVEFMTDARHLHSLDGASTSLDVIDSSARMFAAPSYGGGVGAELLPSYSAVPPAIHSLIKRAVYRSPRVFVFPDCYDFVRYMKCIEDQLMATWPSPKSLDDLEAVFEDWDTDDPTLEDVLNTFSVLFQMRQSATTAAMGSVSASPSPKKKSAESGLLADGSGEDHAVGGGEPILVTSVRTMQMTSVSEYSEDSSDEESALFGFSSDNRTDDDSEEDSGEEASAEDSSNSDSAGFLTEDEDI